MAPDYFKMSAFLHRLDEATTPLRWICATYQLQAATDQVAVRFTRLPGCVDSVTVVCSRELTNDELTHICMKLRMRG